MRTPDNRVVAALTRLYSLVIIVGLPGSGKTDFAINCIAPRGYVFHDNFVSHYSDGGLRADIAAGRRVCVADARLCDLARFWAFMRAFARLVPPADTLVVIFENDTDTCIANDGDRMFIRSHCVSYDVAAFAASHSPHIVVPVRAGPLFAVK
jgi:hypothetical protein